MRLSSFLLALSFATPLSGCGAKRDATPSLSGATPREGDGEGGPQLPKVAETGVRFPTSHEPPLVTLSGESRPAPAPPRDVPVLFATAQETRIFEKPETSSHRIGVLKAGAVVEINKKEISGSGCPGGFRAIKPMGYVCLGPEATLDPAHPVARAATVRPDTTQKLPYMYGTAKRGGPAYARLPIPEDLREFEPHLRSHLSRWGKDKESGATYGQDLWLRRKAAKTAPAALEALDQKVTDPDIPPFLLNGARLPNLSGFIANGAVIKAGEFSMHNGVAFLDTFNWQGRRYGLSTDLRLFPTDRFRPIRGSDFHGAPLGAGLDLPIGFVRAKNQKRFRIERGHLTAAGPLPWRSVLALTGKVHSWSGTLYYETKDGDLVAQAGTSKIEPAKKLPGWAVQGEKWIDVNVTRQTLVLYQGDKPVYATLVSTGEAGLDDPETSRSTKRGIFRIHTKYVTATMDSKTVGEEFELRDVPYVQYFQDGYALHAAYWHDVFGQPKSHGCINLAPEDARRIFFWTEPDVPAGWHGAAKALTGTVIFIHP